MAPTFLNSEPGISRRLAGLAVPLDSLFDGLDNLALFFLISLTVAAFD